ncbi:MAG: FAD-dependent oxidoreductase [Kiritimatiellae bacterium]|nr:FAD-dependent oxidoreductase [Kiritimatiellia bacterium]
MKRGHGESGGFQAAPGAGEFDVVVAGGSCTGVFAAVRAAEAGCRVALVEAAGGFGGTATQGLVPIWHSLFSADGRTKIIGGLTDEVERELVRRGEARMEAPDNPARGALLNVAGLQMLLDGLVAAQPRITPFLHTRLAAAECDRPGRVAAVVVADKSGLRRLRGRFFVDATGDADLCRFAGLPVWRQPKESMQAHTLCAILAGADRIRAKHPDFSFDELMRPERGAGLGHVYGWGAEVLGAEGLFFHAYTRVADCDPSVPGDLTRAEIEGRAQLRRIVDAANRAFPMPPGEGLSVVALAAHAGLRESCHVDSPHRVTADEILGGRRFDDCIARGSYRVDIHEGAGITFKYLDGRFERTVADGAGGTRYETGRWREARADAPTWYEIPYRSIVPKGAENVLAPGRALDCDRDAYGACRVMVNCNQMGEAAGRAAANALARGLPAAEAFLPVPLPPADGAGREIG